jgi:hypothetical protein
MAHLCIIGAFRVARTRYDPACGFSPYFLAVEGARSLLTRRRQLPRVRPSVRPAVERRMHLSLAIASTRPRRE